MLGVCSKSHIPHRNRRRKTLQQQNRAYITTNLVAHRKTPHPHKEQKTPNRTPQNNSKFDLLIKKGEEGPLRAANAVYESINQTYKNTKGNSYLANSDYIFV
jgi:hypothetical protein